MKAVARVKIKADDGRIVELYRCEEEHETAEEYYIGEWAGDLLHDLRELFLGLGIDINLGDDE